MDAAISQDELQLAARNHGLPLEALRYPITPAGLHYLLIHYDIPDVDADRWTLSVDGRVAQPLTLTLADLRNRSAHEVTAKLARDRDLPTGAAVAFPGPSVVATRGANARFSVRDVPKTIDADALWLTQAPELSVQTGRLTFRFFFAYYAIES